jgi:rubrerythrin
MDIARSFRRWQHRAVWGDPERRRLTLESFAVTEEDGGKDLVAAARRVTDAELRGHLERHARDEHRHAELFRRRAGELVRTSAGSGLTDKAYDLSRGRRAGELDAHGFFNAGLYDELGEVEYVAMLHVAEKRAAELFAMHAALNDSDPETRAIFEEILRDEKYHVAYTGRFLDQWRAEGRAAEVERALRNARGSRALGAWKRLGARSGAGFGRALLYLLYWTLLAPFGLLARRQRDQAGWRAPRAGAEPGGQY